MFVGCDPPDGTARPRYRRTTSLDAETPALTIERRRHAFPALAHDHRLRHRPEGPFFGDDEIPRLAASIIATRPAGAPPFSIAWRGFHLLADARFEPRRAQLLAARRFVESEPPLRERDPQKQAAPADPPCRCPRLAWEMPTSLASAPFFPQDSP